MAAPSARARRCRPSCATSSSASKAISGDGVAELPEHRRHPYERQADERGRIRALDPLEQSDAQALCLEPAGAIERLLPGHVALDLRRGEPAEEDTRLIEMH